LFSILDEQSTSTNLMVTTFIDDEEKRFYDDVDYYENEFYEYEDEFKDDMEYIYEKEETEPFSDFDTILDYVKHYRWLGNFWIFGVPWFIIAAASNDWNLFFNIEYNYWWAGGNLFLVWNTIFGFI
jgi:hypothetical protein